MKQDLEYNIFIERYLEGEMTPEELKWFEKELDGNIQLKKEVELHSKVDSALSDSDLIDLKNQLDLIHQEIEEVAQSGKGAIQQIYRRVYYTATALAVGVILFTLYFTTRDFSSTQLVEEFYQPETASVTFRGEEQHNQLLEEAMNFYNQKEYAAAIKIFESILSKDNSQLGINLYSGISYMEMEKYTIANEKFQNIIDQKPNPFVESATWYLGMCYIMTEDMDKAEKQFNALAKTDGYYKKDARRILRRIN